jgi:hypothetical protein
VSFEPGGIRMEFTLGLRKDVKGGGEVTAWVVEAGAACRATGRHKASPTPATGHCGRRAPPAPINGLLDVEPGPGDTVSPADIHLLAALCSQHAAQLDGTTHARVRTGPVLSG